jgi:hypothetical protein
MLIFSIARYFRGYFGSVMLIFSIARYLQGYFGSVMLIFSIARYLQGYFSSLMLIFSISFQSLSTVLSTGYPQTRKFYNFLDLIGNKKRTFA